MSHQQIDYVARQKAELINNNLKNGLKSSNSFCSSFCGQYYREVVYRIQELWYFTCRICEREFQQEEMETLAQCVHNAHFCRSCLTLYIKFKLVTHQVILCPSENCKAPLDISGDFFRKLPVIIQKRYKKIRASIEKLHDANFRVCPSEDCEGSIIFKGNCFSCKECQKDFCLNCLADKHHGQCYLSDIAYFEKHFNMRRCPNCKFMVEKSAGCDFMRCRCKFQFCFGCNGQYNIGHQCKRDEHSRVIIQKPIFKEEVIVDQASGERTYPSKEGIEDKILLGLLMVTFIIPMLLVILVVFIVIMVFRGILLILKILFITFIIILLGVGPFSFQFLGGQKRKVKILLAIIYPIPATIGCYRSFRQLSTPAFLPLLKRFKTNGGKLYQHLFVELFQ